MQNICKCFVNFHTNLQCYIKNLQKFCKDVSHTQKRQQRVSVGLKSMGFIFNGGVKVFEVRARKTVKVSERVHIECQRSLACISRTQRVS